MQAGDREEGNRWGASINPGWRATPKWRLRDAQSDFLSPMVINTFLQGDSFGRLRRIGKPSTRERGRRRAPQLIEDEV